jgi:hypothetical protein
MIASGSSAEPPSYELAALLIVAARLPRGQLQTGTKPQRSGSKGAATEAQPSNGPLRALEILTLAARAETRSRPNR